MRICFSSLNFIRALKLWTHLFGSFTQLSYFKKLSYRAIWVCAAFRCITKMINTSSTSFTSRIISAALPAYPLTAIRIVTIFIIIAVSIKLAIWGAQISINTILPYLTLACVRLVFTINHTWIVANRSVRILNGDIKVQASTNHWSTFKQAVSEVRFAHPKSAAVCEEKYSNLKEWYQHLLDSLQFHI